MLYGRPAVLSRPDRLCVYINTRNTDPMPQLSTRAQKRRRATHHKYNVMYYVNNTLERRIAEAANRRRKQQRAATADKGGAGRAFEPRDAGVWPEYGVQSEGRGHAAAWLACRSNPGMHQSALEICHLQGDISGRKTASIPCLWHKRAEHMPACAGMRRPAVASNGT